MVYNHLSLFCAAGDHDNSWEGSAMRRVYVCVCVCVCWGVCVGGGGGGHCKKTLIRLMSNGRL